MKRVGFFAGSFDPIHDGHLEVAKAAVEELELDQLLFMVEEKPWGNKNPTKLHHRRAMVDLALDLEPKINQLEIEDKQFTISQTLPVLEKRFESSELYFIFGADVFLHMNRKSWSQLNKLLKHYLVIFERKNTSESEITEHAKSLGIVVAIIPSTLPHHSSTDVRLNTHNKLLWIPKLVSEYIDREQLYNDSASSTE